MRPLVVDASAALKLVRPEERLGEVRRVLRERRVAAAPTIVPEVFWLEVVNTLTRRHRYRAAAVLEAVYELEQIGLTTADMGRPGVLTVIDLVERFDLTAYDAAYLALAEATEADLMTADSQLAGAAGDRALFVGQPGVAEPVERYELKPGWPTWPGAAAYLRELRARLSAAAD